LRRAWSIVLFVIIIALLASGPSAGEHEEAALVLEPGESIAIAIDNTEGEDIWIESDVRVLTGPEVNVWFTDEQGYTQFYTPPGDLFTFYPEHSMEDTTYLNESWAWSEVGIFYLIIENDSGDETANVQYMVTWEPYALNAILWIALVAVILVIMVVVVVMVFYATVKRAQAKEAELKAEEARAADEGTEWDDGRPRPPAPYPEWVVEASMREMEDDDATGWDPSEDEPED
jgi:hypothetical protein